MKTDANATHVVMRSFPGPDGRQFRKGEKIDATSWANLETLERQKLLGRLGGAAFDPHAAKVAGIELRARRRAFDEVVSKAQSDLRKAAEAKREAARGRADRALAEDLGKIGAELDKAVAAAAERLRKEHGFA